MGKVFKSFIISLLSFGLIIIPINVAPALADSATGTNQSEFNTNPLAIIEQAKQVDSKGLEYKVNTLRTSQALMTLFVGAPREDKQIYLEFFAAISTTQQVESFVANTQGKHFVVDESKITINNPLNLGAISLVNGPAVLKPEPRWAFHCWKAWLAAGAFFLGTQMTCAPLPVIGGLICNGIFFVLDALPDFNSVCN